LAERAPSRLVPLLSQWRYIQALGWLALESYHLRVHGASFAEHFYGLRRQASSDGRKRMSPLDKIELARRRRSSPGLPVRARLASLVEVALLPLLTRALDRAHRRALEISWTSQSLLQQSLVRLYPNVRAIAKVVALAYRVLYLFERTSTWSPVLHLVGLQLVRHFPTLGDENADGGDSSQDLWERLWHAISSVGVGSLWGAVYLMQFGQWWYQREHLLQPYQPRKIPPPPPPRPPYAGTPLPLKSDSRGSSGLVLLPHDPSICPLCHLSRRNPAMSCSGYVFCYPCLVRHLQQHPFCPVTGRPMAPEQIRRIVDDALSS